MACCLGERPSRPGGGACGTHVNMLSVGKVLGVYPKASAMCADMSIWRPVLRLGPMSVCGISRDLPLGAVTTNQSPSVERSRKAQPCAESGTPSALLLGRSPRSTQLYLPLYCE